ncbi:4'-phosphopantetheinyl transferase superfamily protein [Chitinophaga sp. HK235]|uniref:4'-phosphopantetheinyl transferase family protein n=1 Tax=Chitinophaga sp. HK235 TaxID=2952571 RepID=UPI001BACEB3B|nr:4'-phosphopantetheinyl transferase superfamily protein [Chitinophaga sp. HK235]
MEVRVYYASFDTPLSAERFSRLLEQLPEDKQQQVLRYKRWQDAHASLLGKHLLLQACSESGYPADLRLLQYTVAGRPYLPEYPDFNISHSGNMVVCALAANGRIGIDIEKRGSIDIMDFKDQFTMEEWKQVMSAEDPVWQFYEFWTIKEAVAKANGVGIVDLPSVHILSDSLVRLHGFMWTLTPLLLHNAYAGHIATESIPSVSIREVVFD